MQSKTGVIVINERDNVATALNSLKAGTTVSVRVGGAREKVRLLSDIPKGHKFALVEMVEGAAVIKYGEPIGQATARIDRGEHVHVHNLVSQPRKGEAQ
jgi:altronate dehydratase small subunit